MPEDEAILAAGVIIPVLTMVMLALIVIGWDKGNFEIVLGIILPVLFLLLPVNDAGSRDSHRLSCPGVG
jgi:hypothetical protein